MKRFKAGPVELEWDQLIETAEKQVAEVTGGQAPEERDKTISEDISAVIEQVPAAAVMEAFARAEQELRDLLIRHDFHDVRRGGTLLAKQAYRVGLISEEILGAFLNMTRLRNEAAHRVGKADISADQAREYVHLVDDVVGWLRSQA